MRKRVIMWAMLLGAIAMETASQPSIITIEQCVDSARVNYPIIKKLGLMRSTEALSLEEINTAWLPRVTLTGQTTWQNVVPTFPGGLSALMSQMGTGFKGIPRWQYRAGIEVSQTLWDGGTTSLRRNVERTSAAAQQAGVEADIYAVRERVENLYFALLLIRTQIEQSSQTHTLMESNLERARALVAGGAALPTDADMIEAQMLTLAQQITQAETAAQGYADMLTLFTGLDIASSQLVMPTAEVPADLTPQRPELSTIERRKELNNASQRLNDSSFMPKVALFAQGFYGNPGLDNFKSMTDHAGSINFIGGLKGSWTFDALYTRANARRRTTLANAMLDADREAMVQNLSTQTAAQLAAIEGVRKVAESDSHILTLRTNVREAAESQLRNGVIDATALLNKITDENLAALALHYRRIQLQQEIYKLKYIINR